VELREWQRKLKDKVIDYLRKGYLVALQAPTGSGKTLFALYTMLNVKDKIIFVVRTHNEFFPIYREHKRLKLNKKFSFIVGKPTACPYASPDVNPEDIKCNNCKINYSITLDINEPPNIFIKNLKSRAINENFCPYYSLLETSIDAEVIVMTYSYFFLPYLRENLDIDFENYGIVIDEAHNLDYINDLDERKLTRKTIEGALREVKSERAKEILKKLLEEFEKRVLNEEKHIEVENITCFTKEDLEILEDEYEDLRDQMIIEGRIKRLNIGTIIKFLKSLSEENRELFSFSGSLVSKVIDSSKYLDILNHEEIPLLIMSGTLPPKEYLEKVLNIRRKLVYIDAEKETRTRLSGKYECLIGIDVTSAYTLRTENMWKKYGSYIIKIFYNSKNNILVVFPSYEIMNKVMSYIKSIPTYIENESSTIEELYNIIMKSKTVIGVVSRGKLSEGIELTINGKSVISDVVLVGIPYPAPDDYMKIKSEVISKRLGYNITEMLFKIPAMISVKQAIGRAIRGVDDEATVWLLDKRYDNPWWKQKLKCFNSKKIRL
jgi:DNA excision repair protein ERCC-2